MPDWIGHDVVLIASGPSLTQEDVDYVRGKAKVIVINNNYQLAPWADALFAADYKWWNWHGDDVNEKFQGQTWCCDPKVKEIWKACYIRKKAGRGFCHEKQYLHTGGNSGYMAMNLGYLFGAKRLILLGYDMKFGADDKSHWFGDHPDKIRSNYKGWMRYFADLASQDPLPIINCTRDTALDVFEQQPLEEVL